MSAGHDDAGWSWWPAPAKLNLFLHITGRRADGYHELQTVFRLLDWGDRIGLRLREDGQVRREGEGLAGVAEADDWRCVPRACSRKRQRSSKVQTSSSKSTFPPGVGLAGVVRRGHGAGGAEPAVAGGSG